VAAESEIGNTHKLNADLCLGTRMNFDCLLHYTRKVAEEFAEDPYFGFFWQASLTHDYIEYPQLADDSYHDFLEYLTKKGLLSNTMLVFMSDHGMRWGSFRQTYQGHLEDSLPFVFISLPHWWRAKHALSWNTLKKNTRSLTSPFDLHETLRDILEPSRLSTQVQHFCSFFSISSRLSAFIDSHYPSNFSVTYP
jgi:membrane-anchored protein YejM (alkaline phosphatase superfamily)